MVWFPGGSLLAILFILGLLDDGPHADDSQLATAASAASAPANSSMSEAGLALEVMLQNLENRAVNDPESALNDAAAIPDKSLRQLALSKICYQIASMDPAKALALASRHHLDQEADWVVKNLVQQWAQVDIEAASGWALQQAPGSFRDSLVTRLAFLMARNDPAGAVNLARHEIPAGTVQTDAVAMIVQQWTLRDPAGAATWRTLYSTMDEKGSPLEEMQNRTMPVSY